MTRWAHCFLPNDTIGYEVSAIAGPQHHDEGHSNSDDVIGQAAMRHANQLSLAKINEMDTNLVVHIGHCIAVHPSDHWRWMGSLSVLAFCVLLGCSIHIGASSL